MTKKEIENIKKINDEIENFESCYKGNELFCGSCEFITSYQLISFLIENPHFQDIANNIKKLK
jgi:hypothetical protein